MGWAYFFFFLFSNDALLGIYHIVVIMVPKDVSVMIEKKVKAGVA